MSLLSLAAQAELRDTIIIEGMPSTPPYCYFDGSGSLIGFIPDVVEVVMDKAQINYELKKTLDIGMFDYVEMPTHEYLLNTSDLYALDQPTSAKRMKYYYSAPYLSIDFSIATPHNKSYKGAKDLVGMRIVTIKGSASDLKMRLYTMDNPNFHYKDIIKVNSSEAAMRLIQSGGADCLIQSNESLFHRKTKLSENGLVSHQSGLPPLEICFCSNNGSLIEQINPSIEALTKDGTLHEIYEKWLFPEKETKDNRFLYFIIICSSGFIIILIIIIIFASRIARRAKIAQEQSQQQIEATERVLQLSQLSNFAFTWNISSHDRLIVYNDKSTFKEFEIQKINTIEKYAVYIHIDHKKLFMETLEKALSEEISDFRIEFLSCIGLNNEYQWVELRGAAEPFSQENIHFIKVYALSMNIHSQKQTQIHLEKLNKQNEEMINDLKIANQKALESEKLKMSFLANMSHEIRTPLNAIVGFSELMMSEDSEPEEREEYMKMIQNNNELLLCLINDILDLSRIESSFEINASEFDFALYFDQLTASLKTRLTNPNVEFIVVNPYKTFITSLDKNRIAQIVNNYVSNSIKFTDKGSITVGYELNDNELHFYVRDTGIGVPEEKQHLLFQRFQKLDDFAQGTGLGLAIISALMEKFGGACGCDSTVGVGSYFWIRMPVTIIEAENA